MHTMDNNGKSAARRHVDDATIVGDGRDNSFLQSPFIVNTSGGTGFDSPEDEGTTYSEEDDHNLFDSVDPRNLVPLQPVGPDRYAQQPRSKTGKIVYVVFGGANTGIFFNWAACDYCLRGFSGGREPFMRGYDRYEDAKADWVSFCATAILPQAIKNIMLTPQRAGGSQPSPSPAPRGSPAHVSYRGLSVPMAHRASPTLASQSTATHCPTSTPKTQPGTSYGHQQAIPKKFYVILVGYTPGVFFDYHLAQHSVRGLSCAPIQEVSTREEANQIFVDAVMGGRVYQHEPL
ncbi:hypothetical protein BYT27DRAFT_7343195 [Phlegmacium glaucopus]|nr:hypothetical protein BYT27DRAFT_7343195 [Phlegmacium glaucopus]